MKKCVYGWGFRQDYRSIVNFLECVDDTDYAVECPVFRRDS